MKVKFTKEYLEDLINEQIELVDEVHHDLKHFGDQGVYDVTKREITSFEQDLMTQIEILEQKIIEKETKSK